MVTVLCLVQGGECGRIGCWKARISSGVAAVPVKFREMATIVVMNVWVKMDSKLSCIESVACSKAENARRRVCADLKVRKSSIWALPIFPHIYVDDIRCMLFFVWSIYAKY